MPKSRVTSVVVRAAGGQLARKRKVKKGGQSRGAQSVSSMAGCNCTLEYFKSLVDPFENGDIKLGWGCMVPTTPAQAYFRGSANAGTDGSITIAALPCVTGGVLLWNTSATTAPVTSAPNYQNATAVTANCGEGRCVSIGVRAFPNIALTSVPGAAYSGATVATTYTNLNTMTTNDFVALPTSHQSIGVSGVSSTGRPVDPESFIFSSPVVDALGFTNAVSDTTKSLPFSVPYVSFIGLPASAEVFFEVVLNIEATQVIGHSAQTILPDSDGHPSETVGDYWPVPESFIRALQPYLPHPGRPGEAAAVIDNSFLQAMWAGLKGYATGGASGAFKNVKDYMSTPAQKLMGTGGTSGQRLSRSQFGGYLK